MTNPFMMPPTGFGPGSQPLDHTDQELEYMPLPQDMRTYAPRIPEVEALASADLSPALALLTEVTKAAKTVSAKSGQARFDLSNLDDAGRALVAETLGSGEVSAKVRNVPAVAVQESVFAGIWILRRGDQQEVVVAGAPDCLTQDPFRETRTAVGEEALRAPGVANAPSILIELKDKSRSFAKDAPLHVINLSLLPHTEQDLVALDQVLGEGAVTILSRGYGNCRITATALEHVWRVQFFNSQDKLILDTFEITEMPEVAVAAPEDLADSAKRLTEVIGAIS